MINIRVINGKILFFLLFALLFVGCVSIPYKPQYLSHQFAPMDVTEITVLPIADFRKDTSINVDYQKLIDERLKLWLPKMGYQVAFATDFGDVDEITEDDIITADKQWVKKLGPTNASCILLVSLNDLVTRRTYGSAYTSECSGVLFDKMSGEVLWKHKSVAEAGMGGLLGMLDSSGQRLRAVYLCAEDLLTQFPTKNGRKWQREVGGSKRKTLR